jgi:hypothetical protein
LDFPNKFLNSQFFSQPEDQQIKAISAEVPEFGLWPKDRQRRVLNRASQFATTTKPAPPPRGPVGEFAEDVKLGFRGGEADVARTVGGVAHLVGAKDFEQKAEQFASRVMPTPEETRGRTGLASQIGQGVGAAVPTIVKYLPAELAGKYAPIAAGGIGAASHAKEGWKSAVKEGVKDALQFRLMGEAGRLPTRTGRALASAGMAAGTTAAFEGGDVTKATAAGLMGGTFGAVAGEPTEGKVSLTPEQGKALLEGGVEGVSKVKDFVLRAVAPQTRGAAAAKEAHIIRANASQIYRQADIAEYALRNASKATRMMPDAQRMEILDNIETGAKQVDPVTKKPDPKLQGFVDTLHEIHNQVRDELIEEGSYIDKKTGEKKYTVLGSVKRAMEGDPGAVMQSYYENYAPHEFTNPTQAAEIMRAMYAGKRPLEGPATFTHQRTHPTLKDALSILGPDGKPVLKMVTTDPVEAYMLKWREMKRFTAALRIVKESEEAGIAEWVPPNKRGPEGWVEVRNSRAFRRMHKEPDGTLSESGRLWMPEKAARVLNNYLSPGLRSNEAVGPAFRALIGFNNVLNQAQLGFSAFHLGFTSVDAVTSRFALGLERVVEGTLKQHDPKMVAKGVTDLAKSVTIVPAFVENMKVGRKMRDEWRKPGSSNDPKIAELVQMMQESGGGLTLDPVYRTNMRHRMVESMRQHNGFVGALMGDISFLPKTLLAANEKFAAGIMNNFVPWQKLGVFADLMKFEMERLPEGAPREQVRAVGAKAWDSVDNRMGMLRYDNLFWEKWIKDMSMATFRSVGWNLGTLRELGGGMMDWRKAAAGVVRGKNVEFTHRMAYTLAMPAITGLMGGMNHYAYNGKPPEQLMDWFFPRTGRKDEFGRDERISIPSYIKDSYHILSAAKDAITPGMSGGTKVMALASSKIHSSWGAIADMLMNKDYYSTEIANADDPFMKKMGEYAQFLIKQYNPFSVTNIMRERKLGFPLSQQLLTVGGFIPAPSDIKKTAAERLTSDIMAANLPRRPSTREERERQDARRELERKIRMQDNWEDYARTSINSGALSDDDILYSVDRAAGLPLDRSFARMRLKDSVRVWKVASTEEKRRLKPLLETKIENSADKLMELPDAQRRKLMEQLWGMLNEQLPAPPPGR